MEKKKRVRNTKVGDVFVVNVDEHNKVYMQYIISDLSQLNSDVVRVFQKKYSKDTYIDLLEVISGEVDFYAHCCTRAGLKRNLWEFVENIQDVGSLSNVIFRDNIDMERTPPKVSYNWWVWKPNQERKYVGKLPGKYWNSDYGIVFVPENIVCRIKTGKWMREFPGYR